MFDPPGFRTPRLRLRALRLSDLDAYAAMCADPEVMRYIGAGGPIPREMAWRHLAMFLGTWALHGHGTWAVERRSDAQMIGRVGFIDPPDWPGCELAWLLARDAWGQGYAFEAASAALAFGRQQQGLGELISLIRPDNARSIRLAEKLGASPAGPIDFMGSQALLFRHPPP